MQMIFQDPFGSLNPRQTIRTVLDTALKVHRQGDRAERERRMAGDRRRGSACRPMRSTAIRTNSPAASASASASPARWSCGRR